MAQRAPERGPAGRGAPQRDRPRTRQKRHAADVDERARSARADLTRPDRRARTPSGHASRAKDERDARERGREGGRRGRRGSGDRSEGSGEEEREGRSGRGEAGRPRSPATPPPRSPSLASQRAPRKGWPRARAPGRSRRPIREASSAALVPPLAFRRSLRDRRALSIVRLPPPLALAITASRRSLDRSPPPTPRRPARARRLARRSAVSSFAMASMGFDFSMLDPVVAPRREAQSLAGSIAADAPPVQAFALPEVADVRARSAGEKRDVESCGRRRGDARGMRKRSGARRLGNGAEGGGRKEGGGREEGGGEGVMREVNGEAFPLRFPP